MAYTNSTTHYELPQWLGTDKPTFLVDMNGAFSAIDSAMHANAQAASAASGAATSAQNTADAAASAAGTATAAVNALSAEGTWTPALTNGGTTRDASGYYYRLGKFIYCYAEIVILANQSGAAAIKLDASALPFEPAHRGFGTWSASSGNKRNGLLVAPYNLTDIVFMFDTNSNSELSLNSLGATSDDRIRMEFIYMM